MTSSAIGTTSYEYDNQRRLIGLVNHRNQNFNFEYDSANRIKKIITPVMESSMSFDSTNFLTNLTHVNNSGTVINSFEYVRDALGNRIQIRTPAGNFNYSYDQNSQLTSSQSPEVGVESFTYDPLGNRITDQSGNYIYDSKAQRLVEDYQYFYNFDDNGNLSSKVTKDLSRTENYTHDSQNRMIEFAVFEGTTKTKEVKYFYDALGRRIRKESVDLQNSTTKTINFLYDGNEVIAKADDSNQVLVSFTHSSLRTDDPLAMHVTAAGVQAGIAQSSGDIFYAKDTQGSVIDLLNSNGLVVQHYVYSAFGKILSIIDGNGNDVTDAPLIQPLHTFTGKIYDVESGLIHFFARMYDPNLGRFIQIDPDQGKNNNPLTFGSKYIYSLNDPINRVDPLGRISFKQTLGLLLIGINPVLGLALVNTEFGQKTFDFSKRDVNRINKVAIIAAAVSVNVASGGTLTPVLLTTAGAGLFTAAISPDGQFFDNFLTGASAAAVSGAIFASAGLAAGDVVPVKSFQRIITILTITQNPNFQHSMESFLGQNDGDPFPAIEF